MEIKWANVFALGLLILALVILLRSPEEIGALLGSLRSVGSGHSPDDQMTGLIALGLILVALVGVVKILAQSRRP